MNGSAAPAANPFVLSVNDPGEGGFRLVPQADARLKEAAKLGFKSAFVPAGTKATVQGLSLTEVTNVAELLRFAPEPKPSRRGKVES